MIAWTPYVGARVNVVDGPYRGHSGAIIKFDPTDRADYIWVKFDYSRICESATCTPEELRHTL